MREEDSHLQADLMPQVPSSDMPGMGELLLPWLGTTRFSS